MSVNIDRDLIRRFESGLDPIDLEASEIPVHVLGYGEISTVFQIGDGTDLAYKRMPLFHSRAEAEQYITHYRQYCQWLREAGLVLPDDETLVTDQPGRPTVLYIGQKQLPAERFCHQLIRSMNEHDFKLLVEKICAEIQKIWLFNESHLPSLELAIDGQLSNWVWLPGDAGGEMVYTDTSTPLFRIDGQEQLNPELFLQSAPSFLRWIIRWLFLSDVMNRYYDRRQVYIDLAANLHKEQRPDLVPAAVDVINNHLTREPDPLTVKEVEKYYKEDRLIWSLFLAFRRFDRRLKTKLFRQRYEFILPGKIER